MKIVSIVAVIVVSALALVVLNNSAPSASQAETKTFACERAEDLTKVLDSYESGGDSAAIATAAKLMSDGSCTYRPDTFSWWQKGSAPEGFTGFEDVTCKTLTNGECVAVQPVYELDENSKITWTGYILVEPRVTSGTAPRKTNVGDQNKTLILNLNF